MKNIVTKYFFKIPSLFFGSAIVLLVVAAFQSMLLWRPLMGPGVEYYFFTLGQHFFVMEDRYSRLIDAFFRLPSSLIVHFYPQSGVLLADYWLNFIYSFQILLSLFACWYILKRDHLLRFIFIPILGLVSITYFTQAIPIAEATLAVAVFYPLFFLIHKNGPLSIQRWAWILLLTILLALSYPVAILFLLIILVMAVQRFFKKESPPILSILIVLICLAGIIIQIFGVLSTSSEDLKTSTEQVFYPFYQSFFAISALSTFCLSWIPLSRLSQSIKRCLNALILTVFLGAMGLLVYYGFYDDQDLWGAMSYKRVIIPECIATLVLYFLLRYQEIRTGLTISFSNALKVCLGIIFVMIFIREIKISASWSMELQQFTHFVKTHPGCTDTPYQDTGPAISFIDKRKLSIVIHRSYKIPGFLKGDPHYPECKEYLNPEFLRGTFGPYIDASEAIDFLRNTKK